MKLVILGVICACALAQSAGAFNGRRWNVSTGNMSVGFIRSSPIGAGPLPDYMEPPPPHEVLVEMKRNGLVVFEDYVAWGAVEREQGKWDWTQHDRVCEAMKKAGLEYVVYNWVHFPPVWLRDGTDRTLMRCIEHGQDTNYLSIFDPKTVEYYDRFYRALSEHFGDRIDGVYACILGPYGEGNYPLYVPDWVNTGHCHEGYWCADPHALSAFRDAMRGKYGDIAALNAAWGTSARSFADVRPPREIADGLKPSPGEFQTPELRRRWVDFMTWYHQALIDFAEQSVQVTLRYFPKHKVRTKPGGNAGGVNPVAWGTYCPGYAKMAGKYGIVLQPADCRGAYFGDKWIATAYHFYGVPLSTEAAGNLDPATFAQRMFSDASCGASQLFTYEFLKHAPDIQRYVHLYTGRPGNTDVAVLCPTTLYRLGADLQPTIQAAHTLRDLTDYDVLDELLITDGALTRCYRTFVVFQGDFVEQAVLDRIVQWVQAGGTLVVCGSVRNVEGETWAIGEAGDAGSDARRVGVGRGSVVRFSEVPRDRQSFEALYSRFPTTAAVDGVFDGVWTTKRGRDTLLFNTTDKPVRRRAAGSAGGELEVEPHTILSTK